MRRINDCPGCRRPRFGVEVELPGFPNTVRFVVCDCDPIEWMEYLQAQHAGAVAVAVKETTDALPSLDDVLRLLEQPKAKRTRKRKETSE